MLPENEARELQTLQRKAYGRDGVLTDVEAQRLHALETRRRLSEHSPSSAPEDRGPDSPATATATEPSQLTSSPGGQIGPAAVPSADPAVPSPNDSHTPSEDTSPAPDEDADAVPPSRIRRVLRGRVTGVLGATAVLLLVGVAAGWALFAPRSTELALTAQQEQRRAHLADDYDSGSLRAIAQDEDALAWFATQDEGEMLCLILDVDGSSQENCVPADEVDLGASVSLPVPVDAAEIDDEVAQVENVYATLMLSADGEPMVAIQRWSMSTSLLAQFEGAERDRAEELLGDGYRLGLSIVGYFRDKPVWLGDNLNTQGVTQRCLIVDAVGVIQCAPINDALQSGLEAQITEVDQSSGDAITTSALQVRFTRWQTPYLTVTSGSLSVETSGDSFRLETGVPGDPIRIEIPNLDTDG